MASTYARIAHYSDDDDDFLPLAASTTGGPVTDDHRVLPELPPVTQKRTSPGSTPASVAENNAPCTNPASVVSFDLLSLDDDHSQPSSSHTHHRQARDPLAHLHPVFSAPVLSSQAPNQPASSGSWDDVFGDVQHITPASSINRQASAPDVSAQHHEESSSDSQSASAADLEDPGVSSERRELIIYALPLFKDQLVYLPVCNFKEQVDYSQRGWLGKIQEKLNIMTNHAKGTLQDLKEKDPNSFQHKVYKAGRRMTVETMSPEERLMSKIPSNITKIVIRHPSSIPPDQIMEKLTGTSNSFGIVAGAKAALATIMLPVAFGIDILIIPGPQVLTYYTLWQMWRNGKGVLGSGRLTKYVTQDGKEERVRVNYAGDARLDKYVELSADAPDGVLADDDIEALCKDLREPELLEVMFDLRDRQRRMQPKRGSHYSMLPSNANQ